jgi:GTP-binding protein
MHIDFRKMRFLTVAADISDCPESGLPEIVLAGRSNSGKSSLVNAMADRKDLARISSSPGKTRLVVYFDVDGRLLVADLPGYGFAQAAKHKIKDFSALADQYFSSGRKISLALVLMDIRHEPSAGDRLMIDFLDKRSIPYLPVFTKSDKLSRAQKMRLLPGIRDSMATLGYTGELFAVSTQNREGLAQLTAAIEQRVFTD